MGAGAEAHLPATRREEFSRARLLYSRHQDPGAVADEARYRAIERLYGVSTNLVTLIALGMLAHTAHNKARRLLAGPGGPTRADAPLAAVALNELRHARAGTSSRETPLVGTFVAIARWELYPVPSPAG